MSGARREKRNGVVKPSPVAVLAQFARAEALSTGALTSGSTAGGRGRVRGGGRRRQKARNSRRGEVKKNLFSPATLFAKVLLLDAGTAVLTGDADLFLDARLLTGRGFDLGLESELTFFPSGVVRGHVDLQLLVGVGLGSRGLSFPIRRREDAEGDRDAGFKIQVGDLVGAKRLSSPRPSDGRKVDKKIPSCFFWKEVERKEVRRRSEKDPSSMLGFLSIPKRQDGVLELAMRFRGRLGGRKKVRTRASAGRARTASNIGAAALRRLVVGAPASGCWTWDHRGVLVTGGSSGGRESNGDGSNCCVADGRQG